MQADGTDSVVDLSSLASFDNADPAAGSSLAASNGGTILAGGIRQVSGTALAVGPGAFIPTAQITNLANGSITISGVAADFSGLTSLDGDMLTVVGGVVNVTNVTSIVGASLYASGGGLLDLPGVRQCAEPDVVNSTYTWQASGTGSVLRLANLTNVLGAPAYWELLKIQALAGGRVELPRLVVLDPGYDGNRADLWRGIQVQADGTDSVVDLSSLARFDNADPAAGSSLAASNGGGIWAGVLRRVSGTALTLWTGAVMPTTQITDLLNSSITLNGATADFSGLTSLNGDVLTLAGGAINVSNVTSIDGASFYASGGAVLSLPAAQSYAKVGCGYATWQASDPGSRIVLAGLTNVSSSPLNCGQYWLNVTAQNGGRMDLGSVQAMSEGYISVLADGPGSIVDLHSLSGFMMDGQGSLVATNDGLILFGDQAFLLANVAVSVPPGKSIPPSPTLTLYGQAWHSYQVEKRDTSVPGSPWMLAARVPLTNAFQAFAPSPPPSAAFRVWEFVADPPIVDIYLTSGGVVGLVLYGAPPKSYAVQQTPNVRGAPAVWSPWDATGPMTNSFRLFPAFVPADARQFYRGMQQ